MLKLIILTAIVVAFMIVALVCVTRGEIGTIGKLRLGPAGP